LSPGVSTPALPVQTPVLPFRLPRENAPFAAFRGAGDLSMTSLRFVPVAALVACLLMPGFALAGPAANGPGAATSPQERKGPPKSKKKPATTEDEQDRPQGQASIAVGVNLVTLQALVTDQKGNVITGLRPENFTVYEDNVKQEITNFSPVDANVTVVMLVEFSRQIEYFVRQIWEAIYGFAATLKQGDWVAVIGYDMRPEILSDFTQDRNKLYEALQRFTVPAFSESNLSDALVDTLDRVEEIDGKFAVLLVSTGLDTFSKHTYDEALNKCKAANASIYAISVGQAFRIWAESRGLIGPIANLDFLMADKRLKTFAEFTGGEAYFPRFVTEFPSIFSNISAQLRNQYSIAYASSNPKRDGKFRKIKVDVAADVRNSGGKPEKLKVLTRKGYLAIER
jgi:VWFA-related protein